MSHSDSPGNDTVLACAQACCGPARLPGAAACVQAARRIRPHVVRTPVRELAWLGERLQRPVFAKLETAQHTGSFKFRGAINALLQIDPQETVVAASAGNHSLAVAEAARRTGHRVVLILPTTASAIKRERLSRFGIEVVNHGATLDEATAHARALASAQGWRFLSPYNDARVIAGQASVGFEIFDDIPETGLIVSPMGGGGLAAGVGLASQARGQGCRIIGVQPERFASMARSLRARESVREVYRPSLADGLLVNIDEDAATLDWASRRLDDVLCLGEEAIAAGFLAVLGRESLLCEPSGAIGVGAIMDGRLDSERGDTPIVIVLSGGNVTLETIAELLSYPFKSEQFRRELELMDRGPDLSPAMRPIDRRAHADDRDAPQWSQAALAQSLTAKLAATKQKAADFLAVCQAEDLPIPRPEQETLAAMSAHADRLLQAAQSDATDRLATERLLRVGHRMAALLDEAQTWQASAIDQNRVASFDAVAQQRNPNVNYTRYNSETVEALENRLLDTLGLSNGKVSALATSSGMAAITLAESWLRRHRLRAGDRIVCQPGLYFETLELFNTLPDIALHVSASDAEDDLIAAIRRHAPRVVLLEPLVNTPGLRLLSMQRFLRRVAATHSDPITLVIDGTMLSGAFDPFAFDEEAPNVEIIYIESGAKYLQAGFDLTMSGVLCCRYEDRAVFDRLRRNTGAVLYPAAAALMPRLDRSSHLARLQRMTENCRIVADRVADGVFAGAGITVHPVFPGLAAHPDHAASADYPHLGGVMAFSFEPQGLNNRWLLNACIDHVFAAARQLQTPLSKGVSFGFSTPRISAAWAMSQTSPPFLRLSVGDQDAAETARLAEALRQGFDSFFRTVASKGEAV